jgi:hypothetical protein
MSEIRRIAIAACPKCSEVIWSEHDSPACPRCREPLPANIKASLPKLHNAPPSHALFNNPGTAVAQAMITGPSAPAGSESRESRSAMKRYEDAYRAARVTVVIGTAIKFLGFLLAILILAATWLGAGLMSMNGYDSQAVLVIGTLFILIIVTLFYVAGVIVCAQGQTLKASLDDAVHSSPFLTDEQRAKVMSL